MFISHARVWEVVSLSSFILVKYKRKKPLNHIYIYIFFFLDAYFFLFSCLVVLKETSCHVPPYGEVHVQRTKGNYWTIASGKLNPTNNQVNEFWGGSFPNWAFSWGHSLTDSWTEILLENLRQRILISHTWIPNSQKLWDNEFLMFWAARCWGNMLCSGK
jgi:hypothetical protein